MSQSVLLFGRQPKLGLAEAEVLYGAEKIEPLGSQSQAAIISLEPSAIDFNRLGGSTRLCKLLTHLPTTDWQEITAYLTEQLPHHLQYIPEGKIRLGLSIIGPGPSVKTINSTGLNLKKVIKAAGRSVRVVPNAASELNTAQVLHNQLTGPTGLELVLIMHGSQTTLAQTIAVQDINAYAARDQKRPKRDARVGMLPPKLAQIIVNLAGKHVLPANAQPIDPEHPTNKHPRVARLLDPFCGTGVVLQEAMLCGYDTYGTDLEPRMIEYSQTNLDWLNAERDFQLEVGDATNHQWKLFDLVACETYLGRPFSSEPRPEVLQEVMRDVDTIHRKFLRNLASQTQSGFRACIAVPAWKTKSGFKHLKVLDSLEELGYNRLRLVHVRTEDLLYYRPDQVVARELVILQRI